MCSKISRPNQKCATLQSNAKYKQQEEKKLMTTER